MSENVSYVIDVLELITILLDYCVTHTYGLELNCNLLLHIHFFPENSFLQLNSFSLVVYPPTVFYSLFHFMLRIRI